MVGAVTTSGLCSPQTEGGEPPGPAPLPSHSIGPPSWPRRPRGTVAVAPWATAGTRRSPPAPSEGLVLVSTPQGPGCCEGPRKMLLQGGGSSHPAQPSSPQRHEGGLGGRRDGGWGETRLVCRHSASPVCSRRSCKFTAETWRLVPSLKSTPRPRKGFHGGAGMGRGVLSEHLGQKEK